MIFNVDKEWRKRSYSVTANGKVDEIQRKELKMELKEEREKRRKLELKQKQANGMQNMREIAWKQIYKKKRREETKKKKSGSDSGISSE